MHKTSSKFINLIFPNIKQKCFSYQTSKHQKFCWSGSVRVDKHNVQTILVGILYFRCVNTSHFSEIVRKMITINFMKKIIT